MKKIINDPEHVVSEMLAGIEISDSSLRYIPGVEVIARREPNKEKVAIISGGGSGHEPASFLYIRSQAHWQRQVRVLMMCRQSHRRSSTMSVPWAQRYFRARSRQQENPDLSWQTMRWR